MTPQMKNLQFDLHKIASAVNNLQFWLICEKDISSQYIQHDLNELIKTLNELILDNYKVNKVDDIKMEDEAGGMRHCGDDYYEDVETN